MTDPEPTQLTADIRNIKASEHVHQAVPTPSLEEQRRIVGEADEVFGGTKRLDAQIEAVTARSVSLRRALLDAAFSGRLTGRSSDLDRIEELVGVGA